MNSKDIELLKYRNEVEVMSRLRGYDVNKLYSSEINNEIENTINNQYNLDDSITDNDIDKCSCNISTGYEDYKNNINSYYMTIDPNMLLSEQIQKVNNSNISWDEYFMNVAILTSLRSSDMNTKVGSVLVSKENKIIGTGYNGIPRNLDHRDFPITNDRNLKYNETKYAYVVHAELNSILNSTVFDLNDSKLYCTLFPCNECAKVIIQKGIKEIIYLSDKYHDNPEYVASRRLLNSANVYYRKYNGDILIRWLNTNYTSCT